MTFFKKRQFCRKRKSTFLFRFALLFFAGCCWTSIGDFDFSISDAAGFSLSTLDDQNTTQNVQQLTQQAELLIGQLGDPQYFVRDEAEVKLLKIGGPAIEPLRRAVTHKNTSQPDSEIRLRATRLLILIERKENERIIREFLDGNGNELKLAGWSEFSQIAGTDKTARKLFVDMHLAQPQLLNAIEKGKKSVEELFQSVARNSLRTSSRADASRSIGTLTSLLFVSTLELPSDQAESPARIDVSDFDLRRMQFVLIQPQMLMFVSKGGNKTQISRLIENWLASLSQDETASIDVQISVIGAYRLTDNIDLAIQFAANQELPPATRMSAMDVFGQLATADDVAKLAPLFENKTVLGNYLPRTSIVTGRAGPGPNNAHLENDNRHKLMEVQLRDLALATAIKRSGQNLADFGFDPNCFAEKKLVRNQAGFFTEADRESAFAKWNQQQKTGKAKTTD